MSEETFELSFGTGAKPPVRLPRNANLAEKLNLGNSPLLFGCRTGICGTCLVRVDSVRGDLPPATADEKDVLEILCPNEPKARLACLIKLGADLTLTPINLRAQT